MLVPIDDWNRIERPEECQDTAEPHDLVVLCGNVLCLCKTINGVNHLDMMKLRTSKVSAVRNMFGALYELAENGIEYVRIESAPGRYTFILTKHFNHVYKSVNPEEQNIGRDVWYMKLDEETKQTLNRLRGAKKKNIDNSRFYLMQEAYLQNRNKKSVAWAFMFETVTACCISCAKKLARRIINAEDLHDKAMAAACYIMARYDKDKAFFIKQLEYMCKITARSFLQRQSVQLRDKTIVYTDTMPESSQVTDFLEEMEKRKIEQYYLTPAYEKGGFNELAKCRQLELSF